MGVNRAIYGNEKRHILSASLGGEIVFEQVRGGYNLDWIVKQFRRSCRRELIDFDLILVDGEEYKPGK